MSENSSEEEILAWAVQLILDGRTEEALELLSRQYNVKPPKLRIGLPKGCKKALGCYVARTRTIHLRSSTEYMNPFVVLHEFYHHIRFRIGRHRGTEKGADRFALRAIEAWKRLFGGGEREGPC
ncbi:MAG: hypothetical protein F7C35_01825 [Desulfurococcales archaeon]|nr:hypothetical protein [Desulfurococcales archaeon]